MHSRTLSLRTWKRDPAELFEAGLYAARNAWDIDRRVRGIRPADRRISRGDAERELRRALAALEAGGAK